MSKRRVPIADWARYINEYGSCFGVADMLSLDRDRLLATARARTGLADFGDDAFMQPFELLLKGLEEEAQLTVLGRFYAIADMLRVLESRLEIIDQEKRHPEIADEVIETPIFVLGMGRTGTTIMHELLAQDPANRAPTLSEMLSPAPASRRYRGDVTRLGVADAFVKILDEIDPSWLTKHESAGDLPNECGYMMNFEFMGTTFFGSYNCVSHVIWDSEQDQRRAYRMHERVLKMLQWNNPRKRFVLKDPSHLGRLPQLLEFYPDARIVHTHRDPTRVVASTVSLMASNRLMRSDHFDAAGTAEMMNYGQCAGLEKCIDDRAAGVVAPEQIADVHFTDFMADPVAEVEKLYRHWGWKLPDEAARRMTAFMAAKPKGKHGKHEYAYSEVIDLDRERERFRRYMDHYNIAPE